MERQVNERTALLGKLDREDDVSPINDVTVREPITSRQATGRGRFFFVELSLMLFFFSDYPMMLILQRYVVEWHTEYVIQQDLDRNITHVLNFTETPCDLNASHADESFHQEIQKASSNFNTIQSIVRSVPAVVSTLLLGAASDSMGRRYAIIPSTLGIFLYSFVSFFVVSFKLPVWYILIAEFVYGSCGSYNAMVMGCNSYIVDFTKQERRTVRFSILQVCALIPIGVSSVTVGALTKAIGNSNAMMIFLGLLFLNFIYALIFLQDTPGAGRDSNLTSESLHKKIAGNLRGTLELFCSAGSGKRSLQLALLSLTVVICNIALADFSISTLFVMNAPLCWNLNKMGIYTGIVVGANAIGALIVTPLQKLCLGDVTLALTSVVASMSAAVYKFLVTSTKMMFFTPVFSVFSVQLFSTLRSLISGIAGKDKIGALFGVVAGIEVICALVGNVFLNTTYSHTLHIASGFVFLVVAALYAIAGLFLVIYALISKKESPASALINDSTTENAT